MSKLSEWLEEKGLQAPENPVDIEKLKIDLSGADWPHNKNCMCDGCGKRFRAYALHLLILLDGNEGYEGNENIQEKPFRVDLEDTGIPERYSVQGLRQDSLRGVR